MSRALIHALIVGKEQQYTQIYTHTQYTYEHTGIQIVRTIGLLFFFWEYTQRNLSTTDLLGEKNGNTLDTCICSYCSIFIILRFVRQ